ncbi:hypothetical protein D9619_012239 [Psilocybe cf. subviscida]|uniref:Methyltransferase type 12 domain-containing protein n=1 Tax=Psilocybe cf. subviscida TaxID=2480587 RepID=A0A8H5B719_9AGAR|nr:hypothetical protein D9619_012239 [Psilocybe cf. subviscida]
MAHQHTHQHAHQHEDKVVAANKEHYNKHEENIPDPRWVELASMATALMRKQYEFKEEETALLDFACHIGLTSRAIAPYTKLVVGVDISQTSVDLYNEAVKNQGIEPSEMRAVCTELKGVEGELDGLKFDVITCGMAYHHFSDIDAITRTLAFFLKPGGVLFVTDRTDVKAVKADEKTSDEGGHAHAHAHAHGHDHSHGNGHGHDHGHGHGDDQGEWPEKYKAIVPHTGGFSKEHMQACFEGAGLSLEEFTPITKITMLGQEATIFLAKAVKPSA